MAALTNERDTPRFGANYTHIGLPVKAGAMIYQGALVAAEAGYAVPARKAAGLVVLGCAERTVDNTGGENGAGIALVGCGVLVYDNSAAAPVTQADIGKPCYIEDDQTVTATAAGSSPAGIVLQAMDGEVAVDTTLAPVLAAQAAPTT